MARPRKFDEETVTETLMQTFWNLGYAGTSIPALSAATGLGPGSLYAAFGNKEAMFQIAIARYAAHLADQFEDEARGLEGLRALFNAVVKMTVDDPARRGCLVINAVPESKNLSEATQKELKKRLAEFRRLVRLRLEEAQNDSMHETDRDLDAIAASLAATAIGIRLLGRAGMSRKHLQSIADGAILRHRF